MGVCGLQGLREDSAFKATFYYQVDATLESKEIAIAIETKKAGSPSPSNTARLSIKNRNV